MSCISNVDVFADQGSIQYATDLLRKASDIPLLIVNMAKVGLGSEAMIGHSPAQIEEFIDMGLLDYGHVVSFWVNYKDYVRGFMRLEPGVFYVNGRMLSGVRGMNIWGLWMGSMIFDGVLIGAISRWWR